jgi:hypothetical protein
LLRCRADAAFPQAVNKDAELRPSWPFAMSASPQSRFPNLSLTAAARGGRSKEAFDRAILGENARSRVQCNAASDAPSIGPGLSAPPPWTMTATASTPADLMASTGTLKLSSLPDHGPSLIQRRTTLV